MQAAHKGIHVSGGREQAEAPATAAAAAAESATAYALVIIDRALWFVVGIKYAEQADHGKW